MKPVLLDLFTGAGGIARGFQLAGFDVTGVDTAHKPTGYPADYLQADWLDGLRRLAPQVDAIHASPPCQLDCAYRRRGQGVGDSYPDLIAEVRQALQATGLPYTIENVEGARHKLRDPVRYCGSSFGLDLRRHRLLEANWPLRAPPCDHAWQTPRFPAATNRKPNSRRTIEIGVRRIPLDVQRRAMELPWMSREHLSQAIPPAYAEHVGDQLIAWLQTQRSPALDRASVTG